MRYELVAEVEIVDGKASREQIRDALLSELDLEIDAEDAVVSVTITEAIYLGRKARKAADV